LSLTRVRFPRGAAPPSASTDSRVTKMRPYRVTGFAVWAMTVGAKQAPATASAINFLFIRISFVEVRPNSL